ATEPFGGLAPLLILLVRLGPRLVLGFGRIAHGQTSADANMAKNGLVILLGGARHTELLVSPGQ
ncbi:MAG: hypothetical protein M3252_02365, partial [Actinomycetota bacterium]|nr:hypothetical protein [Actinomycetota bacterium]